MQKLNKTILLIAFLFALSFYFFSNSINEFPSHIHAWSQADRYALALGFTNNGFDFFHPQTFNLNVQFPSNQPLLVEHGITAVDFPLHEYIVALLMKVTGSRAPIVFRLYSLLYSLVGLFFLFKLSKILMEVKWSFHFIIVLFVFTAPVYTYYMDGFIPSVTSLANCFIGYYFFLLFKKGNRNTDFYLSLFFITLAALSRTPFTIFLIAIAAQQSVQFYLLKKINWKEVIAFSISFSAIAAYVLYNAYLRNKYGSVFLSALMPAHNLAEFKEVLKVIYERWFFHYFTFSHYVFFAVIAVAGIFFALKSKASITSIQKHFLLQLFIAGCGVGFYFLLMAQQYKEHDYYFLDSFFPILIFLLLFFASLIKIKLNTIASAIIAIVFSVLFIQQCIAVQAKRNDTGSWDRYQATINNFTGADEFLNKNNVKPDARILVIDAYSPNIPFILMNKQGYSVINTTRAEIQKGLQYQFDYVVIQNQFLVSDVLSNYPELKNYLNRMADNGRITLYGYSNKAREKSLLAFLGLDKMKAIADVSINFDDTLKSAYWLNADKRANKMMCDFDYGQTNNYSGYVDSTIEYGTTFYLSPGNLDTSKMHTVLFEGDFCSNDNLQDVLISCYAGHADVVSYQQYFDLSTQVKNKSKWTHIEFLYPIEKINAADELKVFIWNPKRKLVCYDNWKVRVF